MKRQIRRGVFETNSSSTHSLTMCLSSDYDKWNYKSGETLLFKGSGWCYPKDNQPIYNHFYTKEEAIAFEKSSKYAPSENFDWNDEDAVMEMLHENEWYDSHYYWHIFCSDYETFENTMTTPSGDEVVVFGYYGYDG